MIATPSPATAAVERVRHFIASERLFRRAKHVMVAVSGGPDSLAALLILKEIGDELGFAVTAAHFDHQLRPDSAADLAFVRAFCAERAIPFLSGEGDTHGVARERRKGIEEIARQMRYQFLGFVAAQKQVDAIATGHTADDQAETVLMRMLRGTGVRGLRGMLPLSDAPGGAIRLARPLLCLGRAETEAYCAAAGVTPLHDASNADEAFLRNRVRHSLLPALEAANPGVRRSLIGAAASAREAFALIEKQAFGLRPKERLPIGAIYEIAGLAALPTEALTLVVEREAAFLKLRHEVNRTRLLNLRAALAGRHGRVRFGETVVELSAGLARVGPVVAPAAFEAKVLNVPGLMIAGPWRVEVLMRRREGTTGAVARIDASALQGALRVRPLRPGDRIVFRGLERRVSDLLANAKVPTWERAQAVAIADSARVHAVLTASRVFDAAPTEDAAWFVQLSAQPA
jgi:tRNA(Ile)-lysidine synthase